MSDTKDIQEPNEKVDNNEQHPASSPPDVEKLLQEKLEEALKDIKGKLDKAYNARDEALKRVSDFEKEKRDAELKRLQEEGKHKEAYEMQLAELNAKLSSAEGRNVELTRDLSVRNALATQPFRNDNALEMAYREITNQLVRNDQGVWVHKTGVSIKDYVKSFAESDDNSFLFKPKVSNGSGNSGVNTSPISSEKTSLFKMSQDEVLKLIKEGKLK